MAAHPERAGEFRGRGAEGVSTVVSRRSRTATALMRCLCPLYDTNRRTWIQLQPMSVARSGHGAVAAGQCCCSPQWRPAGPEVTRLWSVRGLPVCHGRIRPEQNGPGQRREIRPRLQHVDPHTAHAPGEVDAPLHRGRCLRRLQIEPSHKRMLLLFGVAAARGQSCCGSGSSSTVGREDKNDCGH